MRRAVFALVVLFNLVAPAGFCCSLRSMTLQQAMPNLTVLVTHRKQPISGIEVEVMPAVEPERAETKSQPVFSGTTDEHGIVRIHGLLPGKYWLTASHREFEAGKEWIEVAPVTKPKAKRRFEFEWGDSVYETRHVAGTLTGLVPGDTGNKLRDILHPKEVVYSGVSVTLRGAFSNEEYQTVSDSTGSFQIDPVPDGIYILTIAGGMKSIGGTADTTTMVMDLTQGANRDALPLRLGDSGCYRTEFHLDDKSR